jgi:hypothetical protein
VNLLSDPDRFAGPGTRTRATGTQDVPSVATWGWPSAARRTGGRLVGHGRDRVRGAIGTKVVQVVQLGVNWAAAGMVRGAVHNAARAIADVQVNRLEERRLLRDLRQLATVGPDDAPPPTKSSAAPVP